jgi:DNA polymerase III alpha subunit
MQDLLMKMQPDRLEDLIAANALLPALARWS